MSNKNAITADTRAGTILAPDADASTDYQINGGVERISSEASGKNQLSRRPGGQHFAVCWHRTQQAAKLGLKPLLAYLVLARGTGADNVTTGWGADSIQSRQIMGRPSAVKAIGQLVPALVSPLMPKTRYRRKLAAPVAVGQTADGKPRYDLVWLPNLLIDGPTGGKSPLTILREIGCPDAALMLLNIYRRCDLMKYGGVPPQELYSRYELKLLGERGAQRIFGVGSTWWWSSSGDSPLSAPLINTAQSSPVLSLSRARGRIKPNPPPDQSGVWSALNKLNGAGLVAKAHYLFDRPVRDAEGGEPMFPVTWTGEAAENVYGSAHRAAAERMLERIFNTDAKKLAAKQGCTIFVAAPQHVADPALVGIIRPTFLTDTSHNRRWLAELEEWANGAEAAARLIEGR